MEISELLILIVGICIVVATGALIFVFAKMVDADEKAMKISADVFIITIIIMVILIIIKELINRS
jgi:hypothetical protein